MVKKPTKKEIKKSKPKEAKKIKVVEPKAPVINKDPVIGG
jgi:hypothetical protein